MKRTFLFIIILCFSIFLSNWSFSQTSISGIINAYTAVDSIYPTKDTIIVADASAFRANDTVMIYQAKGVLPITDTIIQPYNFGGVRESGLNETGKYEIILVEKIEGDRIIFKAVIYNDYDIDEFVQLIRVPSYKNASISTELSCEAWNGSTGGVLALMVSDTLFLNANININGKGFKGAIPFESNGECASIDSALYGSQYFSELADTVSSGFKGEGIAKFDISYRKGLGRWANGGGGSNARFAGGGGGGNGGNGGYGGEEDTSTCSTPAYETNLDYFYSGVSQWNALGGSDGFGLGKQNLIDDSTIFLGGGGGSGTYVSGLIASNGGNGGGVVILIAKIIKSNGNNIITNGVSVAEIASASGAGGGAGGTVVFDVDSVIGSLSVYTKGGNGGNVQINGKSGPGGGGGGGHVLWNSIKPSNVTFVRNGGTPGYAQNLWPDIHTHKAKSGSTGTETLNVKVPLTGFLFNNITSDQQVCMNGIPDLLSGSEPRGGNGTFSFQWKYSLDSTNWVDVSGATERDYQPLALTDTIYYQRIVTSGSIIDEGNDIRIIVHDLVVDNTIFGDDLITCIGNSADTITGTEVVLGGDYVSYQYIWESRTDDGLWNSITPISDTVCLPGTVMDTTFVRRIVISGGCHDTTAIPIQIIGLPQIVNNVISADQEICEGQIPDEIIGGGPQDGDGSYSIYWEEKSEGSNWSIVTDSVRNNFAPAELIETKYFRRTVLSDDCFDRSDSIKINVLPPIDKDSINEPELLIYTCYNTPPQLIDGSSTTGGDGTYSYQWQASADGLSWTNVTTNANEEDLQAVGLIVKTYFRRLVSSGIGGCCSSISDTIEVDIYDLPEASIATIIDTICSGEEIELDFTINYGQFPYTLTYNDGEISSEINNISTTNTAHKVNPSTSIESKEHNYTIVSVVDNNECAATVMNGLATIIVYGIPTTNAGIDDENCLLTYQLSAIPSLGEGIWTLFSGEGNIDFENESSATSTIIVSLADEYKYVWTETNWKCSDSDTVNIILYEKPYNIKVMPEDTILYFVDEMVLKGNYINPDTFDVITTWQILAGRGDILPSVNDSIITLFNLNDLGENEILINWTISKKECADSVISISVKLKELFTPTGFTPNGDGVNDYLKFNGIENSDENELIIYNRWGTEVYSVKNYSNDMGWDGKNNNGNDLPEDTYYYILIVTDDGVSQTHKGFLVIKRF